MPMLPITRTTNLKFWIHIYSSNDGINVENISTIDRKNPHKFLIKMMKKLKIGLGLRKWFILSQKYEINIFSFSKAESASLKSSKTNNGRNLEECRIKNFDMHILPLNFGIYRSQSKKKTYQFNSHNMRMILHAFYYFSNTLLLLVFYVKRIDNKEK